MIVLQGGPTIGMGSAAGAWTILGDAAQRPCLLILRRNKPALYVGRMLDIASTSCGSAQGENAHNYHTCLVSICSA